MALNGSFTIFYIIGDVHGTSGADWSTLPGLAGVTHVFASPTEVCDNCGKQEQQAHLVTSTSPITSLLIDYVESGRLASMEATDVESFLVENLKWRVQTVSNAPGGAGLGFVYALCRNTLLTGCCELAGQGRGCQPTQPVPQPLAEAVHQLQDGAAC